MNLSLLRLGKGSSTGVIARFVMLAAAVLIFGGGYLRAQVVASYDFENGTAQGWIPFYGSSTPAATNAASYTGSYSLLTSTSATGTGGPSISLNNVLLPGAQYTITGWVKLASGATSANANFSVVRNDPSCSGGTCYDTIGGYQIAVTDTGWAQIGGSYTVSATETSVLLYSQLVGATSAIGIYLDDVVITETAPPPTGSMIATYTFNGSTDGWFTFGSPTLTPTTSPLADPNSNTTSLLVTNRTATYMGPALNLLSVNNLVAGATYQVTAYVMLQSADASGPTVSLSTKTADCASSGSYGTIATSAVLTNTAWTKVQGTFTYSNLPGPPTTLDLYLSSSSATDSFYVSDVTIGELAPPPPDPSQQDNTGITSTFEDGGTDGWSGRGAATVAASTAAAHTGSNSLLVTGRTANWNGPSISVSNKMYVGSTYNVSVWVMLTPADGSSHVLNMSLQTTKSGTTSYPGVSGYPGIKVLADGNWHQISVMNYTMSSPYDTGQASLYLQTVPASGTDLVSFYIDDFQLSYVNPPSIQPELPSIYQSLSQYFPVGAAVDSTDLSGAHAQLLAKHFDSMTPGNDLKWSSTEATLGTFTFTNGDNLVGEAVCNNMKVRGQNLVWATGAQTPTYATGDGTNSSANQATVISNIQEHIMNEVQHFGSKVYAWDVINEPIDPSQPDCLVHGPFYNVLGKSYIDVALQAARQYAPSGTLLFINEYSTADPNRLACLVSVIQDLKNRGIPIDGVGHETHNAINYPSVSAMVNSINTIAADFPGINQQITELDLSVYNAGDNVSNYGSSIPPSILAEQGWLYAQLFDNFRQLKGKISAVTIWGMADDDTWLDSFPVTRTDYPLPFDMGLQAKPAYWGIVDPTQLPGFGMTFALTAKSGATNGQVWTLTATNGNVGTAYATQITGLTLTQTAGAACTPVITPPSAFPVILGDIPANGSASASFTIDFTHCATSAQFNMSAPWSVATYDTGTYVVATPAWQASTVTVTPSPTSITTAQALSVTVAIGGSTGDPTPTGTVTLSGGGYTSAATALSGGSVSFNIPAGSLSSGSDTLTASYSGDATYVSATGTATVTVDQMAIAVSTPPTVAPGASTNSTITVTADSTYSGTMNLTCSLTSAPSGARSLPTCSFNPSSITIAAGGSGTGTSTLTVTTTAASTSALVQPSEKNLWGVGGGGALLAAVLMFGIPSRRRRWMAMLVLLGVVAAAGVIGCGRNSYLSSGSGLSTAATTAGNYTFTITGTDSALSNITTTTSVTVTVQ
jgi:endo-1,4-beta-xylanase